MQGTKAPIVAGQYEQIVLTRSAGGKLVGYVNGAKQFGLADKATGYGVIDANATLRFFIDDNVVPGEASSGAVARIRIYNGVLSAKAVKALLPLG